MSNNSPWIAQLKKTRIVQNVDKDKNTDIAIVGAGIAGLSTAFFTLKYTKYDVILLEAYKVAHGATGHNGGQMVTYFERQISDLAKEYGLDLAADAQNAVNSSWLLMQEMYEDAKLQTPYNTFTGYAGCQDLTEICIHLENVLTCNKAQIKSESVIIALEHQIIKQIPTKYADCYTTLPHARILDLIETENSNYCAVVTARKGVINSALFCEDLLRYLVQKYTRRFKLFEHSRMSELILDNEQALLKIADKNITAKKIVLCTNGFEKFNILNKAGPDINTSFHHLVKGAVGYMAAYLENPSRAPTAISYLPKHPENEIDSFTNQPYIYLTRRPFELDSLKHNLISIGGPETLMDDTTNYHYSHPYPGEAQIQIDKFVHKSYKHAPKEKIEYTFKWNGLMGYTPNGLRCIGPDKINPNLLYNLGCNGVGLMPSIYGGKKISQFLNQENLKESIFDPKAW